jgi:Icc-related predicted phosphoesterase
MNKANKKFISDTLDENTILVTHHLPHPICIADQFKGEPTNIWFMSDESETLEEKKPKIAIFGHSHVRTDFVYKGTRYINNSVGYPSEYRPIKQLTFEV